MVFKTLSLKTFYIFIFNFIFRLNFKTLIFYLKFIFYSIFSFITLSLSMCWGNTCWHSMKKKYLEWIHSSYSVEIMILHQRFTITFKYMLIFSKHFYVLYSQMKTENNCLVSLCLCGYCLKVFDNLFIKDESHQSGKCRLLWHDYYEWNLNWFSSKTKYLSRTIIMSLSGDG